jgi:hypothetical protein
MVKVVDIRHPGGGRVRNEQNCMDGHSTRYQVDETDYDSQSEKRWYYRLFCDQAGSWFWEQRSPTPAELAAPHAFGGVSWEPMALSETLGPTVAILGPFAGRGEAVADAEAWFESRQ